MPDIGSGKTRDIIQTALLIIVLLFIVIDRIVVPQVSVTKATETAVQATARLADTLAIENRITKLETNYTNIQTMLEKIDKKLGEHIEKAK